MTDERDELSTWQLLLDRREFLQLGVATPFLVQDFVSGATRTPEAGSQVGGSPAKEGAGALRPPPPASRSYFPLESELVSVRGLSGRDDQPISLRNLAWLRSHDDKDDVFDGDVPNSVRELITPQQFTGPPEVEGPLAHDATGWENWLEDYKREGAKETVAIPDVFADKRGLLVQRVVHAASYGSYFRAVGSGHSHSEAAQPKEFYTDLKEVSGKLEQKWLRDNLLDEQGIAPDHLIRLKAGIVLKKLNRDILPDEGLALPNMGAWDGQTLAGAVNTSTHGTGLGLGTFADLVQSVEIITVPESQYARGTPYVRMLRVEPTDGITDPAKFARDTGAHEMGLVQDDDLFHSVVVGYGCMGIVYAYTLKLEDPYWLHEDNEIKRWGQFNPGQGAENNRNYSIYVDLIEPQLGGTSTPLCLVRTRNEVEASGRAPTERSNRFNMEERLTKALNSDEEDFFKEYVEQLSQVQDFWEGFASGKPTQMFGYNPPFRGERHETASYIALRRRAARHPNNPDKPPEPPSDVLTMEVGVPVSEVVPAVDTVIRFVKDNPRFLPAPLGVRFTDASGHFLSPEYSRPTAMLELPMPLPENLKKNLESVEVGKVYLPTSYKKIFFQKVKKFNQQTGFLDHFLDIELAKNELEKIEDILVRKFDGRPHMGKHNTVYAQSDRDYMKPQNMYPEYQKWKDAYAYLNKFGTFDGAFSDNKVT